MNWMVNDVDYIDYPRFLECMRDEALVCYLT